MIRKQEMNWVRWCRIIQWFNNKRTSFCPASRPKMPLRPTNFCPLSTLLPFQQLRMTRIPTTRPTRRIFRRNLNLWISFLIHPSVLTLLSSRLTLPQGTLPSVPYLDLLLWRSLQGLWPCLCTGWLGWISMKPWKKDWWYTWCFVNTSNNWTTSWLRIWGMHQTSWTTWTLFIWKQEWCLTKRFWYWGTWRRGSTKQGNGSRLSQPDHHPDLMLRLEGGIPCILTIPKAHFLLEIRLEADSIINIHSKGPQYT